MKATLIFDVTYDGSIDLFKSDRKNAHMLAQGKNQSLGTFITMLANELDNLPKGMSLFVNIEIGDILK